MKRILILLIVIAAFITSCNDSTDPQNDYLTLKISPSDQTVNVNDQVTFSVVLENAENLFGFSAELLFNGNIVELPEDTVVAGDNWGENSITVVENEIDRLSVTIGLTQSSNADAINGDVTLFSFTLQGKAIGSSELWFQDIYLIDEDGNSIPEIDELEIKTGNITVH
jgi:type 1 fimbria pilin